MIASAMITPSVITAIAESFTTAYGKNGFPWFFRIWYSRRYSSFSRLFIPSGALHAFLLEGLGQLRFQPRRRGRPELGDEIDVDPDQGRDQDRDQEHVDRIEARERGCSEFGPGP